jgi:hypothetical protein
LDRRQGLQSDVINREVMRVTDVDAPPRDDRFRLSDVGKEWRGGGAVSHFASEGTSQTDESVREEMRDQETPTQLF